MSYKLDSDSVPNRAYAIPRVIGSISGSYATSPFHEALRTIPGRTPLKKGIATSSASCRGLLPSCR